LTSDGVMDTTDPDIVFDERGVCHHCAGYDDLVRNNVFSGDRRRKLNELVDTIKREGIGKRYDCLIGVSGGVDSSYVAYKVKELGLRPLAVHLDNGWDSELAVQNIEKIVKTLDIDLHTYVIDWEEFKDIQLSFLRAATPDSEIPSDHAIVSVMHQTARRLGIKNVIWGYNVRTETHLPRAWSQGHWDWKYVKSVHRQFRNLPIKTFPHLSGWYCLGWYRGQERHTNILDYLEYSRKDAMAVLERELEWRYYGGKHYESIYTRFYQGYILPRRFGFDKRKVHFSSLICSGEITREEALEELKGETYPAGLQQQDKEYVIKKLDVTEAEFEAIMNLPRKSFSDYPSYHAFVRSRPYTAAHGVYRFLKHKVLRVGVQHVIT
jgi:N-acetyl sugar amidotransferase